jgi:NADPH-dependent glutamate synthase beta subunit-like oxidoreductase
VILEKTGAAGGMLRADGLRPKLPLEILEQEMGLIFDLGISFCPNTMLGRDLSLEELCHRVDAVFLAMGEPSGDGPLSLPI